MPRYLVQHRRGSKAQWESSNAIPLAGELVVEIDEVNNLHKLKIGDGEHTYSELAYLQAGDELVTQILTKTLSRVITVTLDKDKWEEVTCTTDTNLGYYGQVIEIEGITEYSRLDLQPNADMLAEFQNLNLVFVTENNGGTITVYSVGDVPLKTYTIQATIVEAEIECETDRIVGIPVGTPVASGGGKTQITIEELCDMLADYANHAGKTIQFVYRHQVQDINWINCLNLVGTATIQNCSKLYKKMSRIDSGGASALYYYDYELCFDCNSGDCYMQYTSYDWSNSGGISEDKNQYEDITGDNFYIYVI